MATAAELAILIRARDEASRALDQAKRSAGGLGSALSGVGKIAAGVGLGVGITQAPAFLLSAARAAADDAASQAKLKLAVENTGVAWNQYKGQMDTVIKSGMALGFSDDQIRNSLSLLTAQTGSASEAQKRFKLAMDLSRGANIDVETASRLLGKVTEENANVLARYGIIVKKGTSGTELFGAVQEKFGGQAETFAKSSAGQMAVAEIKMDELKETLGRAVLPALVAVVGAANSFIPVLEGIAAALEPAFAFFVDHPEILAGVAATIVTLLTPAIIAWTVATWAQVTALAAQAAAMVVAYAPLIAIAIGIGLVIAAVVLLIKHWDDIKRITIQVWNRIKTFLSQNWREIISVALLILTGPFGLVALFVTNAFGIRDKFVGAFVGLKDRVMFLITALKNAVVGVLGSLWGAIANIGTGIKDSFIGAFIGLKNGVMFVLGLLKAGVAGILNTISNGYANVLNGIIRALNSIPDIDIPGWVPGVGGNSFGIPNIPTVDLPTMQRGGTVLRTGLAVVHEGERFSGVGKGLGGDVHVHIQAGAFTGDRADAKRFARWVHGELRTLERGFA